MSTDANSSILRAGFAVKSGFRLLQILLAAFVVVYIAVTVEELAGGMIVSPWWLKSFLVRVLSCCLGSAAGYFVSKRHSYAILGAVVAFYLWYDWSRITFITNWFDLFEHPFDWYPFSFPSGDVLWLATAIPPTIVGLVLGRYAAGMLATWFKQRVTDTNASC
jgi:hypothetical protein